MGKRIVPSFSYYYSPVSGDLRVTYDYGEYRQVHLGFYQIYGAKDVPQISWVGFHNAASVEEASLLVHGLNLALSDSALGKDYMLDKMNREGVHRE